MAKKSAAPSVIVTRKVLTAEQLTEKAVASTCSSRREENNYRNIEIADMTIESKSLESAEFHFSKLTNVTFNGCDLSYVEFKFAELNNVTFQNCKVNRSYFNYARCNEVKFADCILDGSEFDFAQGTVSCSNVSMESCEFNSVELVISLERCAAARSEFNGSPKLTINAQGTDFTRSELNDSVLEGNIQNSVFTNAEFNGSNGTEMTFQSCKMRNVETEGAKGFTDNSDDDDDFDDDFEDIFK